MSGAARCVALLRGVNVSGRNKVPMAELRAVAAKLGWTDVATYIQSGNVVFTASGAAASLEDALERAVASRFGVSVPVIVRSAAQWRRHVADAPFSDAAQAEPNRVLLALPKSPPAAGAAEALQARAMHGELVVQRGNALYIHFAQGVGSSKLSPALIDRLVGSPVTARNWRTVLELDAMLRA